MSVRIGDFIASIAQSDLSPFAGATPWSVTQDAEQIVSEIIDACGVDFSMRDGVAVHRTARIETGASIKGPAVIGPNCFVAATALIRGGCWLERDVIIGPSAELKTSFVFAGSKLAHLNFVGDSLLGADVNLEAGALIANYRNERADKRIRIATAEGVVDTGVEKFGAIVGDGTRIGANAVIAPGALIAPRTIAPRLSLIDQAGER
jgi:UDP-N-acetylglucosamine diphosphorylase / glucose-1-phosphate thymidylyltransferase / UDP-N-acetylgalactosamine diphosphorylase / glucosamine-1-phosphate N-acetyltransferase / galactosamine-1-phosphate N-acetyltransferase